MHKKYPLNQIKSEDILPYTRFKVKRRIFDEKTRKDGCFELAGAARKRSLFS